MGKEGRVRNRKEKVEWELDRENSESWKKESEEQKWFENLEWESGLINAGRRRERKWYKKMERENRMRKWSTESGVRM